MKERILKWWNRKWSNWEYSKTVTSFTDAAFVYQTKFEIYKKVSDHGLVKYKEVTLIKKFR